MAFFKFRKGGDEQAAPAAPPESVEALRQRAKHRLIGAAVLVLLGVIGFPLLVDRQPRPLAVDIPIEIPDKAKVKPLALPASVPAPSAPAAAGPSAPAPAPKTPDTPVKADKAAKTEEAPAPRPPVPVANEGARAQALLDGKAQDKLAAAEKTAGSADKAAEKNADKGVDKGADKAGRFVVQVGAFAEAPKAREVRQKVEHAGLKTYTHVAETKDGRRIRVRVGPFATRAEAEKAAEKIKKLELPAIILTL